MLQMIINIENVTNIIHSAYTHHVYKAFGEAGTEALTRLLDGVRQIYKSCPPEQLNRALVIFYTVDSQITKPMLATHEGASCLQTAREVAQFVLNSTEPSGCVVQVLSDATFVVTQISVSDIDFDSVKKTSIIYRYEANKELILASDYEGVILRVSPALASNFAEPTYAGLDDALCRYRETAAETKCKILQNVWEGGVDGPRLVLVNKPESTMRDSLVQYLQTLIGTKANVRPEQNTDETKPVDIRIDWFGSEASALIEIKWLGRSTAVTRGSKVSGFTNYGRARAQSGAKQLCDYLDRNQLHTGAIKPLGYLVVFDAQRKNVNGAADRLGKEDAFWYESKAINFSPKYEDERDDFVAPVRFFMRPRRSHLLTTTRMR